MVGRHFFQYPNRYFFSSSPFQFPTEIRLLFGDRCAPPCPSQRQPANQPARFNLALLLPPHEACAPGAHPRQAPAKTAKVCVPHPPTQRPPFIVCRALLTSALEWKLGPAWRRVQKRPGLAVWATLCRRRPLAQPLTMTSMGCSGLGLVFETRIHFVRAPTPCRTGARYRAANKSFIERRAPWQLADSSGYCLQLLLPLGPAERRSIDIHSSRSSGLRKHDN